MDIQQQRKSLLNADGRDDNPSGLISEYEAYLSSPAIPELAESTDPRLRLDNVQASWFGSVVTLGAAAGGLLTGCIVDRAGRKLTLMFCSLPFVFGFTIIIAAQDVWMLYAGRVLTGLASGGTSLVVPLYISEMAHERVRGTLGSCVQLMVVLGIIGVYLAGLFVDWRWLALCAAVPPTLLVASMCFMPETPRFLLSQGKQREAEEALRFLRGPHAAVAWECTRIQDACSQQGCSFHVSDLKDVGVYKPLVIGVMLMIFQQMSGINAVMFYAQNIFTEAHFKESDLASVMVGTVQLFFTCVAALIMDKAGRKVLLVISGLVMVISTAAFGLYFHLMSRSASPEEHHANMGWLALLSMVVFITGKPIFSVDIHPDGSKFATGGQGEDSGKVMIWNMAPVLREEDEQSENIPKMLCQMDNHLACVNCVRWSNNGLYLASGGDDKLVMVWKRAAFIGPSTVFGSSSKLANVEQWRCVTILRNHTGDVMDVAWSPHDVWLASCSVDNTVVIWNARKFPELVTCLRGHTGLVKGLTWDPVGKYIASQGDDHSLKVWRTVDWQMEANITKPFTECGGTTHVLRLSWSPDGQYLVSAHAMNNSGPTAQIVERDGWKTNMDFVGHRKAVTVVKFNPKIFKKNQKNGSSLKPSCPYCCCAVGSKDRSLSVWLTSLKRPLVVIHDLFDKSIMDISWTLTGFGMLVCSMDGTIAYLDFSLDELGDPLSEDEKNTIHQNIYGKSLAITSTQEPQLATTIIENPEMLKYQQERQSSAQNSSGAAGADSLAPKLNSVMNGESLEDIRKNLLKKQVETRTADGRRRITPLCIAQLDTGDFSPALFNSVPILPSSLSNQLPAQHSTDSNPPLVAPTAALPQRANLDLALSLAPPANSATKGLEEPRDQALPSGNKASLLLVTATKMEPMKALDSRFTERSKTTLGIPVAISSTAGLLPLDRSKDLMVSALKDLKAKEDTSSDSEDKMGAINKNLSQCKRKPEPLMLDASEVVEKRKKGRPRKDKMAPPILSLSLTQVLSPPEREPVRAAVVEAAAPTPISAAVLRLPTATFQKTFSMQVSTDPAVFLEVENEVTSAAGSRLSQLRCSRDGREWNTLLPSSIVAATGSSDVVAVACQDRMLSVFSSCGRRLLPSIQLNSPVSALDCSARFVMTLTAEATLSVWDIHKQKVVVKNESLAAILSGSEVTVCQSLLTEQGVPVVGLSNGKSFCFSSSLETWTLIADREDCLLQYADFRSCLSTQDAPGSSGPLTAMQGRNLNSGGRLASRLSSAPHHLQQSMTMAFLENQLVAALTLQSAPEYRYWLLIYTRFLVNEGSEFRLREVCKELLGPAHKSATTAWEATTLGLRKRELLREVLPVIGENLRFQRLFTEYQDQLDHLLRK
ncbi:protein HIRA isoform X3 [Stigmatopora argus]